MVRIYHLRARISPPIPLRTYYGVSIQESKKTRTGLRRFYTEWDSVPRQYVFYNVDTSISPAISAAEGLVMFGF